MARTQAVFYRDVHGVEPVAEFIAALSGKPAAKIDSFIEEYLNSQPPDAPPPPFPLSSQVDGELRELRVRFANTRYRILYERSHNLIVLLHALEKRTGHLPEPDKRIAQQRMNDFTARMDKRPRVPPRAAGRDAPPTSRQGS